MDGRCLGRRRRRGMALLVFVGALEHPMVMNRTGGLIDPVEDWTAIGRRPPSRAAFDRCALLSIWKAEGPSEGPRFALKRSLVM